jgi:hypothetical protein
LKFLCVPFTINPYAVRFGITSQRTCMRRAMSMLAFGGRRLNQFSVEKLLLAGLVGKLLKFFEAQKCGRSLTLKIASAMQSRPRLASLV